MPFEKDTLAVRSSDGRYVTLLEPLVFYSRANGSKVTVPVGFESDGASIPQELWTAVGCPIGPYWRPAIMHDWLYRQTQLPKPYCDDLFNEAMTDCNVPPAQRMAIVDGVRAFGWKAFRDDREKLT